MLPLEERRAPAVRAQLCTVCGLVGRTPRLLLPQMFLPGTDRRGKSAKILSTYDCVLPKSPNDVGVLHPFSIFNYFHYWDGPLNWDKGCCSNIALLLRML